MESKSDQKSRVFDEIREPPQWLTKDYFESALQEYENDPELQITNYKIEPCTKPGDNYVGVIFRAPVTYKTKAMEKSDSFIIKIEAFVDGSKKDMMANKPFFNVEGRFYKEILPTMQKLLQKLGDSEILAPECVHVGTGPNKIIVMRDISVEGFQMQRSLVGFEMATLIFKKIAKFHALSMHMNETGQGELLKTFHEGLVNENHLDHWKFSRDYYPELCDLLREWNQEKLAGEIEAFVQHSYWQKLGAAFRVGNGMINVLTHGDAHSRNMMFKMEDGDPKNIKDMRLVKEKWLKLMRNC